MEKHLCHCLEDMIKIAQLINMTVESYEDKKEEIRAEIRKICEKYPLLLNWTRTGFDIRSGFF